MQTLWHDLRYGLRLLARNPGFTAIVVVVLAVGIGANTAVFSVIHAVVLQPLPYQAPGRLVIPWEKHKDVDFGSSPRNFTFLRDVNRSFESLAAYGGNSFQVTGVEQPHKSWAVAVSTSLFPLLGVPPLLGRTFLPQEEQPGNNRVVVVSHAFWKDHLGGTPEAVGRTVTLNNQTYTVVGVMPPAFAFPFPRSAPFWVPLVLDKDTVGSRIARLRKGVTLEQARAEMTVLADRLHEMDPAANGEITAGVDRLLDRALQGNGTLLWLMLGAAGCVLLIACGNVANLFLARAGVRHREVALRVALGASRMRVMRQMLTESLVLSFGAGLLGSVMTLAGVKGLVALCPANIPRLQETQVNGPVLLFALGVSILTGLLFGMMPAWRASDLRTGDALKEGRGSSSGGRGGRYVRGGLVVAQIGVSLVLLMGAGLLVRTLTALQRMDLGFRPENVLVVHLNLPQEKYPEPRHCKAFFEPLTQQIRALPGVRAVSLVPGFLSLASGGAFMKIPADEKSLDPQNLRQVRGMSVSPGFFECSGYGCCGAGPSRTRRCRAARVPW